MPKSRSATPTPNIYATNLPSSSGLTPSRTPTNEPTTPTPGESSQPSLPQFTHFHSFVSSQTSPDDPLDRRPSPDSPPMAKRMRRQSPEDTSRSQSSDSRSGMADTEPEGMSPYSETSSPPPVAPLKKKRTRTLTTPHQSAVLHALLAQSRFPTTAVREEVGRSIGLSARKVQIWFQNQRQKARRPGSQSDASSQPGPPHYTAYQNAPPSYRGVSEHALFSHEREGRTIPHAYSGYPPSELFRGSVDAPPQLLGPGMPGRAPQRGRPVLHLASSEYSRELPHPPFSSRSLPGPRTLDSENLEGTSPFHHIHADPSRTLPPLIFNQSSSSSLRQDLPSSSHLMIARSAPTTPSHPSTFLASPSPSPTFAHNIPEHHPQRQPQRYSTSALGLPPPFTLQPRPQWDVRSPSGPWSRSASGHSTRDSASPPASAASSSFLKEPSPADNDNGDTPRMGPAQPPSRSSGRYDPVRAVFVPTSDPAPAGPSSSSASTPPA
ncbi:hypothetical protein DFH08DRAFT_883217 [Mycena albidolilacea]|uniref:Homeobox domain-containing protein n=1 Tax=Mycena albidolilacea TaxID=1033008 RepID=A0AAD6ZLV4_9AGAR|nr:hypothetical protein DFH08DRAFT_883217 [Mycena albidolilacea]